MLKRLLYRGPSLQTLHRDYAKQGRIDDQAPITTTCQVHIHAPLQQVWALLSNPPGWQTFDRAKLRAGLRTWLTALKAGAEAKR